MEKWSKEKQGFEDFQGFGVPNTNYFKVPNEWINLTAQISSLAELKVVQYILRHTWGFSEWDEPKKITLDEFINGRRRRDRGRLDAGVGLSKQSVIDGLKRAEKHGLIVVSVDDRDKARVKKLYQLRMTPGEGSRFVTPGVKNLDTGGQESRHRSEKDTLETHPRNTVAENGDLKKLPDLKEDEDKLKYVADLILQEYEDEHSSKFYWLVANKVPEQVIQKAISEIRADGAEHPAKVFVHRMKKYAKEQGRKAA